MKVMVVKYMEVLGFKGFILDGAVSFNDSIELANLQNQNQAISGLIIIDFPCSGLSLGLAGWFALHEAASPGHESACFAARFSHVECASPRLKYGNI